MACHEIGALRLGLMRILGIEDAAEREHEIAELGESFTRPGPIQSLAHAENLETLRRLYDSALSALAEKVSKLPSEDTGRPYYQALLVLNHKLDQDLSIHFEGLKRFYQDLDSIHDLLHEIYPAG